MGRSTEDDDLRSESFVRGSRCPQCHGPVLPVVFGFPAGPEPGVLLGGCVVGPQDPSVGCESCGWRGDPPDLALVSNSGVRPVLRSFEVMRAMAAADDDLVVTNQSESGWLMLARYQISELRDAVKAAANLAGRQAVPTDMLLERLTDRITGLTLDDGVAHTLDQIPALLRAGDVLDRGTRVVDGYTDRETGTGEVDRVHTVTVGPEVNEPDDLGLWGGAEWNEGDAERLFTTARRAIGDMVTVVVEVDG